jgi:hypothetical protein
VNVTVTPTTLDVDVSVTGQTVTTTPSVITVTVVEDGATLSVSTVPLTVSTSVSEIQPISESVLVTVADVGVQGPPGVDGTDGTPQFEATNKQGSTLAAGAVVATHSSGIGVVLADADDDTKPAIGLNVTSVASLNSATVQTSGPFELADWTAITGTTTLTAKGRYYLSTTAGQLVTTPPSAASQIVQLVGVAVSDTTLDIGIWDHITL